jgi:hypothetical protein
VSSVGAPALLKYQQSLNRLIHMAISASQWADMSPCRGLRPRARQIPLPFRCRPCFGAQDSSAVATAKTMFKALIQMVLSVQQDKVFEGANKFFPCRQGAADF